MTGTISGHTSGIERSVLSYENCAPRIAFIHTDLAVGMIQTPEEN